MKIVQYWDKGKQFNATSIPGETNFAMSLISVQRLKDGMLSVFRAKHHLRFSQQFQSFVVFQGCSVARDISSDCFGNYIQFDTFRCRTAKSNGKRLTAHIDPS